MKHIEGRFRGYKGLSIYHQSWLPDTEPKAVLLVVHGWAEHSGRYGNLVNYIVPRGYGVCALDLRGHGKSEGMRGYIDRFTDYLPDVKTFFDIVKSEHPNHKVFLFGHSMGGTVATTYTIRYQEGLAGLLLSGASLMVGPSLSSPLVPLARVLSVFLPKLGVTVLDASTISRDKAVVDAYVSDPLVYRGKITCRFGAEMLKTLSRLPSEMSQISIPLLIMQGTDDKLSDPGGSRLLYERAVSKDKTLKLYDGFYHEILNEPGRAQVLADMEAWLAART